jgi:hypothetical protein
VRGWGVCACETEIEGLTGWYTGRQEGRQVGRRRAGAHSILLLLLPPFLTYLFTHHLRTHDRTSQVVMAAGGSVKYFVDAVFNYPTLAEAYNVAAQNGLRNMGIFV